MKFIFSIIFIFSFISCSNSQIKMSKESNTPTAKIIQQDDLSVKYQSDQRSPSSKEKFYNISILNKTENVIEFQISYDEDFQKIKDVILQPCMKDNIHECQGYLSFRSYLSDGDLFLRFNNKARYGEDRFLIRKVNSVDSPLFVFDNVPGLQKGIDLFNEN